MRFGYEAEVTPTIRRRRRSFPVVQIVLAVFSFAVAMACQAGEDAGRGDWTHELVLPPGKVLGHEACAKCHASEVNTWMQTPHSTTFETLHRRPEAKEIADRLGLASIKRNDTCIRCHYTPQQQQGRIKPVSGVSCESCHGAAQDWVESHCDYGGPQITRQQETAAHRKQRRELSIERGMRNPANLYLIARSCLNCHTTPDERLVNVGGHPAGSQDFELVSWSQGKVRHNFVRSGGAVNEESSRERLRVMFVVGVLADLEYSLRATALATEKATFGISSARRAQQRHQRLQELQNLLQRATLQQALDAVNSSQLRLNNRDQLLIAADEVSAAAYAFAEQEDGRSLAAIDHLLPSPQQYKQ